MRLPSAALALLAVAAAIVAIRCQGPRRPESSQTAIPLVVAQRDLYSALCKPAPQMTTVSPSGRFITVESGQRTDFARVAADSSVLLLDRDCLLAENAGASCAASITASNPAGQIRVLGWSGDDAQLYVVRDRKEVIRLRSPANDARPKWHREDSAPLPPAAGRWGAAFAAVTGSAEEVARQLSADVEDAITQAAPSAHMLVVGRSGQGDLTYGTMDRESLSLTVHSAGRSRTWAAPATEAPDGRLVIVDTDVPALMAMVGAGLPFGMDDSTQSEPRLPFARPLIDGRGELIGQFSPWLLMMKGSRKELPIGLRAIDESEPHKAGWTFRSVAASPGGETAVALMRNASGGSLIMVHANRKTWQYECPDSPPRFFTNGLATLGDRERRLDLWLTSQPGPRGTVIYFPGGPGGAPRDDNLYVARQFIQRGWNVATVAQSGSIGNGLEVSGRLRREGFANAVERDAERVAGYVGELPPDHRVVLVGGSFGGAFAAATSRHLKRPHDLVLMAPWMRYRKPAAWVRDFTGTPLISTSTPESQERYEAATFGVKRAELQAVLQRDLNAIYGAPSSHARIFVAFASADTVSRVGDLPLSYLQSSTVVEVGGTHEFIDGQYELWKELRAWLPLEDSSPLPRP